MSRLPALKRFEIFVTKDKTGGDKSQIPTAAQVDFHRQGATVSAPITFGPFDLREVDVYFRGDLQQGDTVQVGTAAAPTLAVDAHPSDPKKVLLNAGPDGAFIVAGDRLVPTNARPKVYVDPSGASPTSDSFLAVPSTGRSGCYVLAFRYDYIVSFDSTTRLYVDADGSFVMRS